MRRTDAPALGISLYLSEPESDNVDRLDRARRNGVSAAFTSLHIPEDGNAEEQPRLLRRIAEEAQDTGILLFADISPVTLSRLELPGADDSSRVLALADWGLDGVRFDDGFGMDVIARVSRQMRVQLNASTLSAGDLEDLQAAGGDADRIEALHNFYPRRDTGLALATYSRMNGLLRRAGLRVGAFAPGDGIHRGPLRDGLPTCEDHRGIDPVRATVELWRGSEPGLGADTVYIGDIDLAAQTWQRWRHLGEGVVPLRWELSAQDPAERDVADLLASQPLTNRTDASDRVIRLRELRPMIGQESPLASTGQTLPEGTSGAGMPRHRGSVTVDNAGYGRYAGEAQITMVDLPPDLRVTVVGQVIEADLPLLSLIPGGARLRLIAP